MSRALALRPEQREEVWELYLRRMSQSAIARHIGCSRNAVSRNVVKMRGELNERRATELEELRTEALAEYDIIKRAAWSRLAACGPNSPAGVGYLNAICVARQSQDRLLGLEKLSIDHRGVVLARVENILTTPVPVVATITEGSSND
jgi:hypothetical protein